MTKTTTTNEEVLFERYESLTAFSDKLESAPTARHWQKLIYEHGSNTNGNADFYGTSTWEEACNLLKNGDTETAKNIKQAR